MPRHCPALQTQVAASRASTCVQPELGSFVTKEVSPFYYRVFYQLYAVQIIPPSDSNPNLEEILLGNFNEAASTRTVHVSRGSPHCIYLWALAGWADALTADGLRRVHTCLSWQAVARTGSASRLVFCKPSSIAATRLAGQAWAGLHSCLLADYSAVVLLAWALYPRDRLLPAQLPADASCASFCSSPSSCLPQKFTNGDSCNGTPRQATVT